MRVQVEAAQKKITRKDSVFLIKKRNNQAIFLNLLDFLTIFFRSRLGNRIPNCLPRDFCRLIGGREGDRSIGKILVANKRFTSPGPAGVVGFCFLCHGLVAAPCPIWRV